MTDATYSRSLAQTNSLGIRQGSLLSGNRMVAPGRRHVSLIPSHSFTRRITASVQYRGNLVVAVANSHTTNDLQRPVGVAVSVAERGRSIANCVCAPPFQ